MIKLTEYSKGSGCGCKLSPADLKSILMTSSELPENPALLVGNKDNDDAAVLRLDNGTYIISTVDFFTPIVDDAKDFGKIAASNAISDVYAMGGTPVMAVAVLGWPIGKLGTALAREMMEGARLVCSIAGIPLAGGHSIETTEPLFGLSVTGTCLPHQLKTNAGAQEGDLLFITKPLGNGIVSAAAKKDKAHPEDIATAIRYMISLNDIGKTLGDWDAVHAMTDITGFGLAGHLMEMMKASNTTAFLEFDKLPLYPFLDKYIEQFIYPDITTKNFSSLSSEMSTLNSKQLFTLCDPQTSGGLLVSIRADKSEELVGLMRDFNLASDCLQSIGKVVKREERYIQIV
ncbi:MAG: selenide, water dikinase SelD [Flavobacteriales bacterium]|jgi:selenide,water dikinase